MTSRKTIVGYFSSPAEAEAAVNALRASGFSQNEIGVAAQSGQSGVASSDVRHDDGESTAYHVGQSAGGAWESVKSFFSGNSAEPYAGEASRETFDDNVITPEHYGSEDVHHSLADLSLSPEHTRYFGHRLSGRNEGALVTVHTEGREEEAVSILRNHGADVGDSAGDFEDQPEAETRDAQRIQLYGEVLRVHKDRVNRGEVRIRKEVVTNTQVIEVPVTREELVLERVPVSGQQVAQGATFTPEEMRIPLSEERAYVDKQAVVREEVKIGKKNVENVETFNETVRKEELKMDEGAASTKR